MAMVLASATAFGTNAILAKLAYREGLGTSQTLAFRFVLAAIGMWGLALLLKQNPLRFERRRLLTLLGLGALVYFGQSFTYFTALRTLPASLCVLIVYVYPSLVVLAGRLFLHRSVSMWHGVALVASFAGVVLLVGGAQLQLSWALVFAIAAPTIYTGYILIGERVMTAVPAVGASAVIMAGAAVSFCLLAFFQGELAFPAAAGGWAVVLALALIPTMIAISLFLAGLPRIGAARSSLLSTWEPVVTVLLAVALLGDAFAPVQLVGAVLILAAAVIVVQTRGRRAARPGWDEARART
ncbi:MAG: DMT family transporter [Chloroflexi bacterium]|nr:MAG: DMT family transporter [Chloroflexota bacterium]